MNTDSGTIHRDIRSLSPGSILKLEEGCYTDSIVAASLTGTQEKPIVIRGPRATIGSGMSYGDYRRKANEISAVQEAGGLFPGVYYLADNAQFILRDCQWVVVEDLGFDGCWPTAIYIDNCQHVTLRRLSFRGSTIAIGATGENTRHLLIEDCDWIQDVSGHGKEDLASISETGDLRGSRAPVDTTLWAKADWNAVHGDRLETKKLVNVESDARAFDGDFFRAWTIPGYVIIRRNRIVDAFNAIHFFNQAPQSVVESFSRNVVIEDNWFVRIRDNAIEPEHFAWNWTIRHNKFVDCYAAFSFEMRRSGFFYVYGNLGWNYYRPGPPGEDPFTGRIFKFPSKHEADGPHYVFNNSWIVRGPVFKKKRFSKLRHFNNIYGTYPGSEGYSDAAASPFGKDWQKAYDPEAPWEEIKASESERFTKAWTELDIVMDGDVHEHQDFPDRLRAAGYPVGPECRSVSIAFADRCPGVPEGLRTKEAYPRISFELELPNGIVQGMDAIACAGAWQEQGLATIGGPLFYELWPNPFESDRAAATA